METSEYIEAVGPVERKIDGAAESQASGAEVRQDFRTLRRITTAVSIILGPLAVGVVRATIPATRPENGAIAIAAMAAHPAMARVELAAGVVASLFLPFAIVGLTQLVMPRAPVFAMIGGAFALAGWALLPAQTTLDAMTYTMAGSGVSHALLVSLWNQVNGNAAVNAFTTLFAIGHELGTLLLGIGLIRARVVPVWGGIAVVLGILMHPVGFGLDIRLVDVLGFALLVAGCAAAARAVVTSDVRDAAAG